MYVLLALLLLGLLITAHEAGHFLAARACGIEVEEFSMGMGPKLLQRRSRRGTLITLRLLPIGGFCQFYGEDTAVGDKRGFNDGLDRWCDAGELRLRRRAGHAGHRARRRAHGADHLSVL